MKNTNKTKMKRETKTYPLLNITEIDWDTDGEKIEDLPTEVKVEWDRDDWDEDEISDYLSDEYDWLVNGYCVEEIGKWEDKKLWNDNVEEMDY